MPRPRHCVPSYRLHKPSGQAVVTIRLPDGCRQDVYLGPYGSAQSREAYARVVASRHAPPAARPTRANAAPVACLTVNELMVRFLSHAADYYRRPDGTPTKEVKEFKYTCRAVRQLHGSTPAAEFGPQALKAVRRAMIDAGLCRGVINRRIGRVRQMFKWAVAEELIPVTVYQALTTVGGLPVGRSGARESEPVKPVSWEHVGVTLRHLNPVVRAMVLVQWYTGARPGEVRLMRTADLDCSGAVWLYRPQSHKTAHHGHRRVIAIGPKAQAVLGPFLHPGEPERFLFSPVLAMQMVRAERRARRKSKVPPSPADHRKKMPKRQPGSHYTDSAYCHAIWKACKKGGAPSWHPHQLRHAFATIANDQFGVEDVQTALGHATLSATQIYAERSVVRAVLIAEAIG